MKKDVINLSDNHKRAVFSVFLDMEEKIAEIERLMQWQYTADHDFKYRYDLKPSETAVLEESLPTLRDKIEIAARRLGIHKRSANLSVRWSIRTSLMYLISSLEGLNPKRLKNYGEVGADEAEEIKEIISEISMAIQETENRLGKIVQ